MFQVFVGECIPDREKLLSDKGLYSELTAVLFQVFVGECIPDLEKLLSE
jgi:hypothetical protein